MTVQEDIRMRMHNTNVAHAIVERAEDRLGFMYPTTIFSQLPSDIAHSKHGHVLLTYNEVQFIEAGQFWPDELPVADAIKSLFSAKLKGKLAEIGVVIDVKMGGTRDNYGAYLVLDQK